MDDFPPHFHTFGGEKMERKLMQRDPSKFGWKWGCLGRSIQKYIKWELWCHESNSFFFKRGSQTPTFMSLCLLPYSMTNLELPWTSSFSIHSHEQTYNATPPLPHSTYTSINMPSTQVTASPLLTHFGAMHASHAYLGALHACNSSIFQLLELNHGWHSYLRTPLPLPLPKRKNS